MQWLKELFTGSCISNSTMGLHNPSLTQTKQLSKMWKNSQTVAFDSCLTYVLYIHPVSVLVCHICSRLVRCLQILLKERWQDTQICNPSQNIYSEREEFHCISCGHWPGFNRFIYVQTRLNLVDPQLLVLFGWPKCESPLCLTCHTHLLPLPDIFNNISML